MSKRFTDGLFALIAGTALWLAPACVGKAPGGGGGDGDDSGGDDSGGDGDGDGDGDVTPDAGPDAIPLSLSGTVLDYQEAIAGTVGNPLVGADLATEGLTPEVMGSSGVGGAFSLSDLLPGSVFYVSAAPGTILNYRPTRSEVLTIAEEPITQDVYLVSEAYVSQNLATVGVIAVEDTAMVVVDMRKNNGTPFPAGDVALADVTLVDALGDPVPGISGPYFFDVGNTMSPDLTTNVIAFDVSRVGFLNVPAGSHQLKLAYIDGEGLPQTMTAEIVTVADGATLQKTGGMGDGGGGGGGGALYFRTDIHPDLQRASQGGLSCAACHTAGGQNPALQFDQTADEVYAALNADPTLINLGNAAQSEFLTNPLKETPPDHPNATFADETNPYYIKWMTWIDQGALLDP